MIDRIIIAHLYQPGSAATNRIFAYARSFAYLRVEVSLILGNQTSYDAPIFDNELSIKVYMIQAPHGYKLNRAMAKKVKELYKDDSTAILIYGTPALCWFLSKSKYNIFYECTEVPFYGRKKTLSSWLKEKIKCFLAKRTTGMLVISKALADYFKKQGIRNIAIINMFVDINRFDEIKYDTDRKYIAYCGTISPFKDGVDCLIKAFSLFYESHPDYELKLIGRFENEEAEKMLKGLVTDYHLEQAVCFTGMINPENMPRLLCNAQMLALARPDNEQARYGFPTKLGEYLATGKPVVVTRVGEIVFFLQDKINCRMAEPGNPEDFANKMSWVADNFDEALELGQKGKELTKEAFSSMVQSQKALSFMEVCINQ